MKKLALLVISLLITCTSFAQGFFTYIDLSSTFIDRLNGGDYKGAHAFFDNSVKDKVTPENLEKLWKQLEANLGNYDSFQGAQNKSQNDLQIVILQCKFQRATQPFQFTFNKDQKLVGFFLAPLQNITNYALPSYNDTTKYTEKLISLKSGKYDLPAAYTYPKNITNAPLVILVHGSGPSDMDETIGVHKPFKDLAIGLAAQGIATLRYVKRTTLHGQDFTGAYTLKEEVTEDVANAINFAKTFAEIDVKQIYVFGHSLGGMLAPKIAVENPDLKGIVLAAAPAKPFTQIAIEQYKYLAEKRADTAKAVTEIYANIFKELDFAGTIKANTLPADSVISGLPASYWADINNLNQVNTAKKLKTKMLILQGGNDYQVTTENYTTWQSQLKGKKNVTFKLYPMLNHLFSFVTEKGTSEQYAQPGNVDEIVISDIANWIKLSK